MTHRKTPLSLWITGFLLTILLIGSILLLGVCKSAQQKPDSQAGSNSGHHEIPDSTISWNVLFSPGTPLGDRNNYMEYVCNYVTQYYDSCNRRNGTDIRPVCRPYFCPCDSTLYTIDILLKNLPVPGSGESASTPTNPGKPPGTGDLANVVVSENHEIQQTEASDSGTVRIYEKPFHVSNPGANRNDNYVLGVIDTGFDPELFDAFTRKLVWKDLPGKPTLFNFLPGANPLDGLDDHQQKHGSAVTALAIQSMGSPNSYPRIMVLKALNKDKIGSIFSVSCALSYAAQNNITMVNASLGYYSRDPVDTVLKHYVLKCINHASKPVLIMAAAGNMDSHRDPNQYCKVPGTGNLLGDHLYFYPACIYPAGKKLISVTGIGNGDRASCFYQRYSDKYIALGVRNNLPNQCCFFWIDAFKKAYEGTSFATPVASGTMMRCIMNNNGNPGDIERDWFIHIVQPVSSPNVSKFGYINYPRNW